MHRKLISIFLLISFIYAPVIQAQKDRLLGNADTYLNILDDVARADLKNAYQFPDGSLYRKIGEKTSNVSRDGTNFVIDSLVTTYRYRNTKTNEDIVVFSDTDFRTTSTKRLQDLGTSFGFAGSKNTIFLANTMSARAARTAASRCDHASCSAVTFNAYPHEGDLVDSADGSNLTNIVIDNHYLADFPAGWSETAAESTGYNVGGVAGNISDVLEPLKGLPSRRTGRTPAPKANLPLEVAKFLAQGLDEVGSVRYGNNYIFDIPSCEVGNEFNCDNHQEILSRLDKPTIFNEIFNKCTLKNTLLKKCDEAPLKWWKVVVLRGDEVKEPEPEQPPKQPERQQIETCSNSRDIGVSASLIQKYNKFRSDNVFIGTSKRLARSENVQWDINQINPKFQTLAAKCGLVRIDDRVVDGKRLGRCYESLCCTTDGGSNIIVKPIKTTPQATNSCGDFPIDTFVISERENYIDFSQKLYVSKSPSVKGKKYSDLLISSTEDIENFLRNPSKATESDDDIYWSNFFKEFIRWQKANYIYDTVYSGGKLVDPRKRSINYSYTINRPESDICGVSIGINPSGGGIYCQGTLSCRKQGKDLEVISGGDCNVGNARFVISRKSQGQFAIDRNMFIKRF